MGKLTEYVPRCLNDIYYEIKGSLSQAGVSMPALEARELICHALKLDKHEFIRCKTEFIPEALDCLCITLAGERLKGKPLAHILGHWSFLALELDITPHVLIPRPETELLALEVISKCPSRLLDLCCGSGCIGLACLYALKNSEVVFADISQNALDVVRTNAKKLNVTPVTFLVDALKKPALELGKFDVIAANPPYISEKEWEELDSSVKDYEPALALLAGEDGLIFYRSIISLWKNILCGYMILETGAGQAPIVADMMSKEGFTGIEVFSDLSGIDRIVSGVRK